MDTPTPLPTTATAGSTASAQLSHAQSLIEAYARLFVANRDRYLTGSRDSGWFTVKKKLTNHTIELALRGRTHLGLMPVASNGTSKWVAWDADTDEQAQALMQHIHLLPEDSTIIERSRRGLHLIRLFGQPVPWDVAYRYGQAYAIKAGVPTIEIYPTGRNSRGLRAPMTAHPKTGEVYGWLTTEGELTDAWEYLHTRKPSAIPDRWLKPLLPPKVLERSIELSGISGQLGTYSELFAEVSRYTRLTDKGGEKAVGNCPFHDDHNPSFGLLHGYFRCWACGVSGGLLAFRALVRDRGRA